MASETSAFQQPTAIEKFFNRALGALIATGIGPAHIYLLEVRGRKTGKLYATPVDPVDINGKRYLVAPRGRAQWVRNAEAAGEIVLRRGSNRRKFRVRVMADEEKPPILKAYLVHTNAKCSAISQSRRARRRKRLRRSHPSIRSLNYLQSVENLRANAIFQACENSLHSSIGKPTLKFPLSL